MGYYTAYRVSFQERYSTNRWNELLNKLHLTSKWKYKHLGAEKILKQLQDDTTLSGVIKEMLSFAFDEYGNDMNAIKNSNDVLANFKIISKKIPGVLITLDAKGEDYDDIWRCYLLNGVIENDVWSCRGPIFKGLRSSKHYTTKLNTKVMVNR